MADHSFSLAKLSEDIQSFNAERDWSQYPLSAQPRDGARCRGGRASRALPLGQGRWTTAPVSGRDEAVRHELADVAICLNLANRADVDLGQAVVEKLALNAAKYPVDKARGRMEKSTEL